MLKRILPALLLSACATATDLSAKPDWVRETRRPAAEVNDCIVRAFPAARAVPYQGGTRFVLGGDILTPDMADLVIEVYEGRVLYSERVDGFTDWSEQAAACL